MPTARPADAGMTAEQRKIVFASSLGTVFAWYDFYLFSALAGIIGTQFFSKSDPDTAFLLALATFGAGFLMRPVGALIFGRLGDTIGRKPTFLVTLLLMGVATFIIGLLPDRASIGVAAPILLLTLRMVQGMALGGEHGGAVTYVAEHAPDNKRGAFTSWLQATATLGIFLAMVVILGVRTAMGEEAFASWGWRIPFLLSVVLLGVSAWIRLSMPESPAFAKLRAQGGTSKAPLTEAFKRWGSLKRVILVLLGLTAGQAVVWVTGHFYTLSFLTQTLRVGSVTANLLVAASMIIAAPFFVVFGSVSDKVGRKKIIMAGCLIAAVTYFPIFKALTHFTNPALKEALASAPVSIRADPATCHVLFNPADTKEFTSSCDIARMALSHASVAYRKIDAPAGTVASIQIGERSIRSYEAGALSPEESAGMEKVFRTELLEAISAAGYPLTADPTQINKAMVLLLLTILMLYVTMVAGPIAATLAESFPTRIRYSSVSLPYQLGNAWFGGLLPAMTFALVAHSGDIYFGLWYPVLIALMTFVIGTVLLRETRDRSLYAED